MHIKLTYFPFYLAEGSITLLKLSSPLKSKINALSDHIRLSFNGNFYSFHPLGLFIWGKLFEEHSLIESNYTIISDGKVYHTDQLTSSNISEGFIVYEKLSI